MSVSQGLEVSVTLRLSVHLVQVVSVCECLGVSVTPRLSVLLVQVVGRRFLESKSQVTRERAGLMLKSTFEGDTSGRNGMLG